MTATCKIITYLLRLLVLLSICFTSYAQTVDLDPEKWVIELSKKGKDGNESYRVIDSLLVFKESARAIDFINKLAGKSRNNYHFQPRFNCLKAHQICLGY